MKLLKRLSETSFGEGAESGALSDQVLVSKQSQRNR